jgi:hypothetical protein
VSGSQIVFPPLEHANFHCGHCTTAVFLCNCCGVGHGKDYVMMGCDATLACACMRESVTVLSSPRIRPACLFAHVHRAIHSGQSCRTGCRHSPVTRHQWSAWSAGHPLLQRTPAPATSTRAASCATWWTATCSSPSPWCVRCTSSHLHPCGCTLMLSWSCASGGRAHHL